MQTKTRVVGSGFTTLNWRGAAIAFMERFRDSGQRPLGQGAESVFPLDSRHAVEIATTRVLDVGTLAVTIRELWAGPVWTNLAGLEGAVDVIDVYTLLASDPNEVTCQMLIKPPGGNVWRGKVYHNCTVTGIDDAEDVQLGALTMARDCTITYTHITRFTTAAGAVVV